MLPGFDPDAHPSLPDAVSRLRRRPAADGLAAHARLADGSGAHAGDRCAPPRGWRRPSCCCSGTTAVLTMETVHDTDVVFEAVGRERPARDDRQVHDGLRRRGAARGCRSRRRPSIDESVALRKRWHGAADGRLRAAFAPRFAVSCSRELLEAVAGLSRRAARARAHARLGIARRDRDRQRAVRRPDEHRVSRQPCSSPSPRLCAAHCVWVDEREQQLLADHDVKVMHCPGSNLKLGSGIAPVPEMRARGITRVARRRRRRLQQPARHVRGDAARGGAAGDAPAPGALPARDVLWMATRAGARTLGLDAEIGIDRGRQDAPTSSSSIATGRTWRPDPDPYSTLVYAARGSDVRTTIVDGEVLVDDGRLSGGRVPRLRPAELRRKRSRPRRSLADSPRQASELCGLRRRCHTVHVYC